MQANRILHQGQLLGYICWCNLKKMAVSSHLNAGTEMLAKSQLNHLVYPITIRNYSTPPINNLEPEIPSYQPRENESIETIKARLVYQSRKRGMLENDLLLSTFADKYLSSMNEIDLKDYDKLINCPSNDWDIYYWATGVKPTPLEFDTPIMKKFVQHVQNKDREVRLRMPPLREPVTTVSGN